MYGGQPGTIAADIGQAVIGIELEVKRELVLTHYGHRRGSNTRTNLWPQVDILLGKL